MRPQVKWSLAALLAGLLAAPALGQRLRRDPVDRLEQEMDTPILLTAREIRKEIKMSEEQIRKAFKIIYEAKDKHPRQPAKGMQAARENLDKALPDILSAEQTKRLQQIRLQVNGVVPFTPPEVQEKLKLTDKQKKEMQTIADDLKSDIRKKIQSAGSLRERVEIARKIPMWRKEAVQNAIGKLSDEQKKAWNEMIGEKIEYPLDILGPNIMP